MRRQVFGVLRRVAPRLPLEVVRPLAIVAGGLAFRSAHGMRVASLHNLSRLLDLPPQHREVRRASLGAFCTLARNYVDMFTVTGLSAEQLRRRTAVAGFEHLLAAQAGGRGVVVATAHLANLDEGGQALIVRGARCGVVAERVQPDWLFDFFVEERRHFGAEIVPLAPGVLPRLQRMLRDGRAVGVACDWDIEGNGIPVRVPGFPDAIRIPLGIGLLAIRARAPIVPIWGERLPDGRVRANVEPPLPLCPSGHLRNDLTQIAQGVAEHMLPRLRARPGQWALFHRVWEPAEGPA